jgi:hypothetical protein
MISIFHTAKELSIRPGINLVVVHVVVRIYVSRLEAASQRCEGKS